MLISMVRPAPLFAKTIPLVADPSGTIQLSLQKIAMPPSTLPNATPAVVLSRGSLALPEQQSLR